jgi:hypothetical protein
MNEIEKLNELVDDKLRLPLKSDGSEYQLFDLKDDQQQVMAVILLKIREWLCYIDDHLDEDFEPLRMTVVGAAGTGKSVLINTLVTVLRKMFSINDVVQVAAPTGCAAFNVGGETIHRLCAVYFRKKYAEYLALSTATRKRLMSKFLRSVAVIFDERSMIGLKTMGSACFNVTQSAHGGVHSEEDWGGIPIIIAFGDDYQLPPSLDKGVFDIVVDCGAAARGFSGPEAIGAEQFLSLSECVMELGVGKRQVEGQEWFKSILAPMRLSELDFDMSEQLVNEFSLQKNSGYSGKEIEELCRDALFISANKEPVSEYNYLKLSQLSSKECPCATFKAKNVRRKKQGKSCFDEDTVPSSATFCVGCRVCITGRNFEPRWGLHNGAIGGVVEIVFAKGKSPLHGDLPDYVVIDLKTYCGPVWDQDNPTVSASTSVSCWNQKQANTLHCS